MFVARSMDRFTFMLLGVIPTTIVWELLILMVAYRGQISR